MAQGSESPDCDWSNWYRVGGGYSRPTNEILLIRGVGRSARALAVDREPISDRHFPESLRTPDLEPKLRHWRTEYWREPRTLDAILLQATAALVEQLKKRLALSFEIRMVSDIFMEWDGKDHRDQRLAGWAVERIDVRNRRLGLAELDAFRKTFGFSLDVFVKELVAADKKRPTGPPPSPASKSDRVTRALKKAGYKITLSQVERCRRLVEEYRPELLPRPAPPSPSAGNGNVVRFTKLVATGA